MARLIGNVDATGSLSTSVPAPVSNTSSVKLYMPFDVDVQDDSASAHSFTASGGAAVSTTQSKFGGKSLYLDGDAKLETSASSDFTFNTNNFTLEGFMYCTTYGEIISCFNQSNPFAGFTLSTDFNNTGKLELFMSDGSGYQTTTSTETYPQNEWVHFACVRAGAEILFFKNGALNGTVALTRSPGNSNNVLRIGCSNNGSGNRFFVGYLDDLRLTNGVALYTSSFVPPSQAVGASLSGSNETNSTTGFTSLYLPFDSDANDDGPNSLAVTNNGVTISSAQAKFGGYSALFDGTNDYLSVSYNDALDFGTNDFTFEFWMYLNTWTNYDTLYIHSGNQNSIQLFNVSGKLRYNNNSVASVLDTGTTFSTGQWYHVALCRQGTITKWFVNGSEDAVKTNDSNNWSGAAAALQIGADTANNRFFDGYLEDFRILNGFAKYTSEFTPPTSAVTATLSQARNDLAVLYLPFDDGLEDKARNHTVTANGNATISATQAKFGGKSLYLDGTGDYLTIPNSGDFNFKGEDFSIEAWVYPTALNSNQGIFSKWGANGSKSIKLVVDSSGDVSLQGSKDGSTGTEVNVTASTSISLNTWAHVAATRSGNVYTVYINGTASGTQTVSGDLYESSSDVGIGANRADQTTNLFTGYIDDLLCAVGYAKTYGSAPSSASGGEVLGTTTDSRTFSSVWNLNSAVVAENFKAGTWPITFDNRISLYLPFDVDIQDDSGNSHTVTAYGTAAVSTTQVKYGAKSLDLSSNPNSGGVATDYLTIPDHSSFDFSGDFTVTAWVNLDSNAGNKTSSVVLNKSVGGASSNSSFYFGAGKNGASLYLSASGSSWNGTSLESSTSITPGNWVHIAWVRNGNVFKIYQDGTETASVTNTFTIYTSTRDVDIGRQSTSGSAFKGYIDDLRVIKGHAEYTSNFTPPTSAAGGVI